MTGMAVEDRDEDAAIDDRSELDVTAKTLEDGSDCVDEELATSEPLLTAASDGELGPAPAVLLLGLVIDVIELNVAIEELLLATEAILEAIPP